VEKIPSSYFSIRKILFNTEGLVTLKVAWSLSLWLWFRTDKLCYKRSVY